MAEDPNATKPLDKSNSATVADVVHVPFIYFDNAPTLRHAQGVININLSANRVLPREGAAVTLWPWRTCDAASLKMRCLWRRQCRKAKRTKSRPVIDTAALGNIRALISPPSFTKKASRRLPGILPRLV